MHRFLWPVVVGLAAAVVLWAPAAQAGRAPSLGWAPITSSGAYDYGAEDVGQAVSQVFKLANLGGSGSGALRISLSGSSAFSITSDACTKKGLGPGKSCAVSVQYAPTALGVTDTAFLVARGKTHGAVSASVALTGSGGPVPHLYWANFGVIPDLNNGTIQMADLDGSDPQTILSGQPWPAGIAVGARDDGIYWSNELDGTLHHAGPDGSNPETLAFGGAVPAVAFSPDYKLYWTSFYSGRIVEAWDDGSGARVIADSQNEPISVAADRSHLYWANFGDGTIVRANLDGRDPQAIVSGLTNLQALALDAGHLYWASGGSIQKAGLDGSNAQTIVGSVDVLGPALAIYGSQIYWADYFEGTIRTAGLDGSNPQTIATGQGFPSGIAVGPPQE